MKVADADEACSVPPLKLKLDVPVVVALTLGVMSLPPLRLIVPALVDSTQQPPYQMPPTDVRTAVPLMLRVPVPISSGRKAKDDDVWLNAPPDRL